MPDLMPDTSIYKSIGQQQQGGIGGMSLDKLLGFAYQLRQMQSQQNLSNAITSVPQKQTEFGPKADVPTITSTYLSDAKKNGTWVTPEQMQQLQVLQQQQLETTRKQQEMAADVVAPYYNRGKGAITPQARAEMATKLGDYDYHPALAVDSLLAGDNNSAYKAVENIYRRGRPAPDTLVKTPGFGGQDMYTPQATADIQARQGGLPAGNPPGTNENIAQMRADQMTQAEYMNGITPLLEVRKVLKTMSPTDFGEGSESRKKFESWVMSLVPGFVPKGQQDSVTKLDEVYKYLANNAQQYAQGLTPHTNLNTEISQVAQPNAKMTKPALEKLVDLNIALRRMNKAHVDTAAELSNGGVNYPFWKSHLAPHMNLDAFRIEEQEPAQVKALQKTLSGKERESYNRSLGMGLRAGVIKQNFRQRQEQTVPASAPDVNAAQ